MISKPDEPEDEGGKVTLARSLFLDASRERLVEEGDPRAAFLFASAGKRVLASDLERYGVKMDSGAKDKMAPQAGDKGEVAEEPAEKPARRTSRRGA